MGFDLGFTQDLGQVTELDSSVLELFNQIKRAMHRLEEVSRQQSEILVSESHAQLESTFQTRESVLKEITDLWSTLDRIRPEVQSPTECDAFSHQEQQCRELARRILSADESVQAQLAERIQRLEADLVQRHQTSAAINQYRRVEQSTDLVARAFMGQSRWIDDEL